MTDYQRTLEYLYSQLPVFSVSGAGAYKPGLDTAKQLSAAFGNPHLGLRCIHIAGTNGKGSISSMIASALQESGLKTGLYTSPHIHDFRERIRINGEMISEDFVIDFVKRYRSMALDCRPSFFELTTIMAFDFFKKSQVDIAVIETGLGGRLDTTNIIHPELCVITNVSIDHVEQLGNTLSLIAAEKAGIIKPGVPVVVGETSQDTSPDISEVFKKVAADKQSPIHFADADPLTFHETSAEDFTFALNDADLASCSCDLKGIFQKKNINTAVHALRVFGLDDTTISRGLARVSENTGIKGRWTVLQASEPRIIYDTGHNEGAWQYLAPSLGQEASRSDLHIVIGFVRDKDVSQILALLQRHVGSQAKYYFVCPSTKRGLPADSLREMAHGYGIDGAAYASVKDGLTAAIESAGNSGTVFLGGSNYVVAEM